MRLRLDLEKVDQNSFYLRNQINTVLRGYPYMCFQTIQISIDLSTLNCLEYNKQMIQPHCILDPKKYQIAMKGRRYQIVGLVGNKSNLLNGKVGTYEGVEYQPTLRTLIRIAGDNTLYKIRPRNLIPEGYTLKTIHHPYQVMTLAEQEEVDKQIAKAQKTIKKQKDWKLCFKYVGPQTNYCFYCHQFGSACYDYCGYCGGDYLRLLHVQKDKLMTFYKKCQGCLQRQKDLNIIGKCEGCYKKYSLNQHSQPRESGSQQP